MQVREGWMFTWALMFLAEIPLVVESGMYVTTACQNSFSLKFSIIADKRNSLTQFVGVILI